MESSGTLHVLLLEYLSAFNNHDIEKVMPFLHRDCRVVHNGQVWLQGVDALRSTYVKDFSDDQASVTLLERRPAENQIENQDDRIRVLLKTWDHRLIDVTYVFNIDDKPEKMIEHIIHSVQPVEKKSID